MAEFVRQNPARWFVPVAVVLIVWGLLGAAALYMHFAYGPSLDPNATDWDKAYYAALPFWFTPVYAVAVLGGLFGSIALLMRSRTAKPLYVASLVGVVVQFGYVFVFTDLLAHKGALATLPFPLFIVAVAGFQIWFANYCRKRGWIA